VTLSDWLSDPSALRAAQATRRPGELVADGADGGVGVLVVELVA
jgi:hypothetical protein